MEVARDPKADWPFQLQEDTPAPSPFELVESPKPSPLDIHWADVPSLLKTGWQHLTGQRPLLKTGQSDVQTLKEGFYPVVKSPIPPPDPTQGMDVGDRPAISPEYGEQLKSRSLDSFLTPDIPTSTPSEALKSDLQRTQERSSEDTRLLLEIVAGLITAGKLPPAAVPSAMTLISSGKLIGILRNLGPEAVRKMLIAAAPAAVDVATGAPEKAPTTFGYGLAGEYIGGGTGRVVSKVGRGLDRARQSVFGETAEGAMHGGVIRDLGETPPLAIASGKYIPKAVDTAMAESVLGGRVRGKYEAVGGVLDDELKRIQALHPGGRVTAERNRIASRVGGLADETRLREVPREVRYQLDRYAKNSMPSVVNADLRTGYQNLDADYFQRPVAWSTVKTNLPDTQPIQALAQQNPGSIFDQTVRLVDNMTLLGDNVALDTAMDMQRTVDGFLKQARAHVESLPPGSPERTTLTAAIQYQLEPILGALQQRINPLIAPYAISLQAAKRNAQGIVARAGVSDAVLEGQLAAGNLTGATVDPDVLLAYHLLKQPDFVTFSEAHGLRHEWLAASRLPGHPLIGESTVTRSKGMADLIDGSMQSMTDRLAPEMTTALRAMDGKYKGLAQLYNSEYIGDVASMNLDDILTQLIRLDRPNDILALRQALGQTQGGGDMLDEVAQMWLSKRLEMVTPQSTKKANIDELLLTLDSMPPQTAEALFPGYPIDKIRDTLRQGKDMVTAVDLAVDASDPVALKEVWDRLTPARRQRAQSDVLSGMFKEGGEFDPINPDYFLKRLQDQSKIKDVLYTPQHYENLYHLAHTARAVKEMAAEGRMRYSPAVRFLERGGPLAAGTGALALMYYGHPVKAGILASSVVIGQKGLDMLATNPRAVKFLTQGMTMPFSAQKAGEITGFLVGILRANGLESEITEQPAQGTVPEQESLTAPGGPARSTD